jgi:nascent polypeptide-associated complex subunit beta
MDQAKLAKLQAQAAAVRIGGKGTPRRKVKKTHKSTGVDDKKLQSTLKKLNVQPIQTIEEVNMFKEDGQVIHFTGPKGRFPMPPLVTSFGSVIWCWYGFVVVHASVPANTFAIYGHGEEKELTELVPGILNQLDADSLASLRHLAGSLQQTQGPGADKPDDNDDDIPDLVENLDEDVEKQG